MIVTNGLLMQYGKNNDRIAPHGHNAGIIRWGPGIAFHPVKGTLSHPISSLLVNSCLLADNLCVSLLRYYFFI